MTIKTAAAMGEEAMAAWLEKHSSDAVMVGLLDLMRIVADLGQVAEHAGEKVTVARALRQGAALKRLCDTGLPVLEALLPPEALEIVGEEVR